MSDTAAQILVRAAHQYIRKHYPSVQTDDVGVYTVARRGWQLSDWVYVARLEGVPFVPTQRDADAAMRYLYEAIAP